MPHVPFVLVGPSFYVGTAGLSSVAVRTSDGIVLIDGTLRASIAKIRALPCDLLVPTHPIYGKLLAQGERGRVQRDPRACRRYADAALALLEARIAEEAER